MFKTGCPVNHFTEIKNYDELHQDLIKLNKDIFTKDLTIDRLQHELEEIYTEVRLHFSNKTCWAVQINGVMISYLQAVKLLKHILPTKKIDSYPVLKEKVDEYTNLIIQK